MLLISSLRSRILLLLLAVVLPMLCIVSYSFYEQRQNMARTLEQGMITDVKILAGVMAQKVDGARGLLSALAHSPPIYNRDSVGCNDLLGYIFKENPQYINMGAADPDGNAFCSALPMTKPVNFSDRIWFQRTFKSPDTVFGNYVIGRIVGKPVLNIAHAARSKSGEVQAAIFVPFDLDQLAKIPEQIKHPWNIEFLILDRNGTILAHDPRHDKWVGKTIGESSLIKTILTRHAGLMEAKGIDGITRIYSFVPVTGTDNSIFVSIGVSRDVYFADTNRIFIRNLMILSVIVIMSLVVAMLISRLAAQAEKEIVAGAEQFRDLYDNAPNGYFSFGADGLIKRCNKRMSELLGDETEKLLGLPVVNLYADVPSGKEKANRLFQRFLSGETIFGEDIQLRKLDGMTVWMSLSMNVVHDAQGQVLEGRAIIQDITERKLADKERDELQMQLNQAQKIESIGQLAGGVAHDFNNMLSVILGYGNMILEKISPDDPLQEYAQEIVNAGTRSATITRQLLAFARKQKIAPIVLGLNETIEEMLKMLRRLIGEDIDLKWHPSSIWPVFIDPSQLDQILANLCVNARDAINGVGKITIETETICIDEAYCLRHLGFTPGDFVQMSVSDDGIGMDSGTISRIFEPFFTTKELGEGTGLGLATVYGIVKQNYGFINVYSEPGQGATFRIYLPRHAEQITASEKQKKDVIVQGHGETILVVEDEASILKLTSRILINLGYVVFIASNWEEAVKLAKENDKTIDLLITDVIMPAMNGRDLSNVLLALHPSLKCLFMSGYTSTIIAGTGVLEQGTHFIQKPFSARDLGAKVDEVLKSQL